MKNTKTILFLIAALFIFSSLIPAMAMNEEKVVDSSEQLTEIDKNVPYGKLVSTEISNRHTIETYVENDPIILKSLLEQGIIEVPKSAVPAELVTKRIILDENDPTSFENSVSDTKGLNDLRNITYKGIWQTAEPLYTRYINNTSEVDVTNNDYITLVNSYYSSGETEDSDTISEKLGWGVLDSLKYRFVYSFPLESGHYGIMDAYGLYNKYTYDVTLAGVKIGTGDAYKAYAVDYRVTAWNV